MTFGSILLVFDHRRNVASANLFSRYYFDRCSSEPAELVTFPYSRRFSVYYSEKLHGCFVTIPRCFIMSNLDVLYVECFYLTYNIS